jgi:hypothetical protein
LTFTQEELSAMDIGDCSITRVSNSLPALAAFLLLLSPSVRAQYYWPKYRHDLSNSGIGYGGTIWSGPAVIRRPVGGVTVGTVYFGSNDGYVYALSVNGQ